MSDWEYEPTRLRYKERWFCYLDLLGFKALVQGGTADDVIPLYREVLRSLQGHALTKKPLGLSYSWFSDTFIIFSRGDSLHDFSYVEQAGRLFFQSLILKKIPVRGALTHGKLYSQLKQNIFIGDALIDAYEYGEKQNWLGFILTPRVHEKLAGSPLDLSNRAHYRPLPSAEIMRGLPAENVYAFAFNNGYVNGKNPYLQAVREMGRSAGHHHSEKYRNTEKFILENSPARMETARSEGDVKVMETE